ncbi:MAG: alpha/beta fold hydrolase [Polyangiaceae bacterium]
MIPTLSKPLAPDESNGFPVADGNFIPTLNIRHINNLIFGFYGDLALAKQHDLRTKLAPKNVVPVVYCCGYDFRVDNAISATLLQNVVNEALQECNGEQAIIIAHSMGGLVARHFCKNLGGQVNVRAVFLVASPTLGAPDAYVSLRTGLDQWKFRLLFGVAQEETRQSVRVMPSVYQLLPNIMYGQVDPNWVTFDATETGWPPTTPLLPKNTRFSNASQKFFVYRDIYTGLLDDPLLRNLATTHLNTALTFDAGLSVSATQMYMHPQTFLIVGPGCRPRQRQMCSLTGLETTSGPRL